MFTFHVQVSRPAVSLRVDGVSHAELKQLEARLMSRLSEAVAALRTETRETLAGFQLKVGELNARVATLEAEGAETGEIIADMEALRREIDAADPTKPTTIPVDPATDPDSGPIITEQT